MSSVATNPRVVFYERVEVKETIFYDGDGLQKEPDIWWDSEEVKRKYIERSMVCEWAASSKENTRDLQ
jgi:hypothetical protein